MHAALLVMALVSLGLPTQDEGSAALHPRVKRAAFADRADMVLIDFGPFVHAAFNPRTCALDMIWKGEIAWKGKVHDFSQETSQAVAAPGDDSIKVDFLSPINLAESVRLDEGQLSVETASTDLAGTSDAWIWFEELGRTPIRVGIIDASTRQELGWFESATHVSSDSDWQWNLKQLPRTDGPIAFAFTCATVPKEVRKVRVLTQRVHWRDGTTACATRWRGYRTPGNGTVELIFELSRADGSTVPITQVLRATPEGFASSFAGDLPSGVTLDGKAAAAQQFEWSAR